MRILVKPKTKLSAEKVNATIFYCTCVRRKFQDTSFLCMIALRLLYLRKKERLGLLLYNFHLKSAYFCTFERTASQTFREN